MNGRLRPCGLAMPFVSTVTRVAYPDTLGFIDT